LSAFHQWSGWPAPIPQGLKPLNLLALFGTTKQAAEKWRSGREFPKNFPQGLKPRVDFAAFAARVNSRPDTNNPPFEFFGKL
jgi:hypothetical protein